MILNKDELKKHFEQNMLDGDEIQGGQTLSSEHVFEYIEELVATQVQQAEVRVLDELKRTLKSKVGMPIYQTPMEFVSSVIDNAISLSELHSQQPSQEKLIEFMQDPENIKKAVEGSMDKRIDAIDNAEQHSKEMKK